MPTWSACAVFWLRVPVSLVVNWTPACWWWPLWWGPLLLSPLRYPHSCGRVRFAFKPAQPRIQHCWIIADSSADFQELRGRYSSEGASVARQFQGCRCKAGIGCGLVRVPKGAVLRCLIVHGFHLCLMVTGGRLRV